MFWGGVERDGEVSCVAGLMLTSGVTRTSWDLLGGGRPSLQPRRTGSVAADDSHPPRQAERGTNHHLRGTVVVVEDSGLASQTITCAALLLLLWRIPVSPWD